MAMRNSGPSCGEANAPARAVAWMIRPAAGARSEIVPAAGAACRLRILLRSLRGLCCCRRAAETHELLILGDLIAVAHQHLAHAIAFLVDRDDGFPARHQKSGHPHHVGEAGIGRLHDHDDRASRRVLLLLVGRKRRQRDEQRR